MEILSAADIKTVDQETMAAQQISSSELMERAAMALVIALWDQGLIRQGHTHHIGFICGSGNNGGDGLAMARILHGQGFQTTVWHAQVGNPSPDNQLMSDRLPSEIEYHRVAEGDGLSHVDFTSTDIVIDALFGVGLTRPITGYWAKLVDCCNEQSKHCS
ncbi:MAG: NAD(P)H-hydrate epimerase, partial [Bacteroidota bacterium]